MKEKLHFKEIVSSVWRESDFSRRNVQLISQHVLSSAKSYLYMMKRK